MGQGHWGGLINLLRTLGEQALPFGAEAFGVILDVGGHQQIPAHKRERGGVT